MPIVYRSWALLGGASNYGPKFEFSEHLKSRNYLTAIAFHFSLLIGTLLLAIPLFRTLARKCVYQPGEGPTEEQYKNDRVEYRGIAIPDTETATPVRAYCRAKFEGSLYACKLVLFRVTSWANRTQLPVSRWRRPPSRFCAMDMIFLAAFTRLHVWDRSLSIGLRGLASRLRGGFSRIRAGLS